ncbi:MAG: NADPH:quinone oxidoreductase family protein [Meiothermus sp.]|uniref:quinone oxidoreductase family protein n=1 Tax=Meiothermus sp. TaxID=1955249 RepID=UPI0025E05ADD|nr:NADPH:quinone oxidoreductase family protein [Meiothermus sp.]MCS7059011.1 NADPH:quinone oxidoreductase family protein [Meiothermus sp.]MCS7194186.1 NADPH:quinone oxidoreductase family protein [Meiothermus sp.]MDW8090047.1 NADPH:quinone oxidoreductase family protein [Meiothermus sp.]MDW8480695.1 NADPH:quinone oxidoreductase family protein [Meiothermus sp.]
MKAVLVEQNGPPEALRYREVPDPSPGLGEVLIRTTLTSLNFADVLARRGGYEAGAVPPFIPGLDVVGVVEALGEGVEGLRVGQRVVAFATGGSYAEKVLAKAVLTYPLPPDLPDEAVAGLTVLVTAYNTLVWAGRMEPGERVLVQAAAGGVGSTAVQMAKALGAGLVLGAVGQAEKAEFVRGLGADAVLTYGGLAERVLELTNQDGVDLILDSVAGSVFEEGLRCLAPFGRLVVFGHASGQPGRFETRPLHRQTKAVVGYSSGHYRRSRPERLRPSVEAVFSLLRQGKVRLQIGARFHLSEASQAHALMESRRSIGKILLYP